MIPHFFRVDRSQHAYLTFITESYEGLCTVSTVDNKEGIVRIIAPEGREEELEGLLAALKEEIGMEELVRDLEFTDVPVLRSDSGQICCARLNKTAGVAGLR